MAKDRIGTRIETLIQKGRWKQAETAIRKQLDKEPDDHWLWSRLSGVKYEQHDYQGALEAADKALDIVPDCPLAGWSYAGALEILGKTKEAGEVYAWLIRRGLEELKAPDADADECWEGKSWTQSLLADCVFQMAGCLAKSGAQDLAIRWYGDFLRLVDYGVQGIYSRKDAMRKLKKLVPGKGALREGAVNPQEAVEALTAAGG
jgi:tetratricopeptide (TPR) repeat protein